MWHCPACSKTIDDNFEACWNCGTHRDGTPSVGFQVEADNPNVADSDNSPRRWWYGYGPQTLLIVMTVFAAMLGGVVYQLRRPAPSRPAWRYDGQFHEVIESVVDRLEVVALHSKDESRFSVSDPAEINEVVEHFCFETNQRGGKACWCSHIQINWCRRDKVVATVIVAHVSTVRWQGFPGGWAKLTDESSEWISQWLQGHGFARDEIM